MTSRPNKPPSSTHFALALNLREPTNSLPLAAYIPNYSGPRSLGQQTLCVVSPRRRCRQYLQRRAFCQPSQPFHHPGNVANPFAAQPAKDPADLPPLIVTPSCGLCCNDCANLITSYANLAASDAHILTNPASILTRDNCILNA